jgi:hypothetical protein
MVQGSWPGAKPILRYRLLDLSHPHSDHHAYVIPGDPRGSGGRPGIYDMKLKGSFSNYGFPLKACGNDSVGTKLILIG